MKHGRSASARPKLGRQAGKGGMARAVVMGLAAGLAVSAVLSWGAPAGAQMVIQDLNELPLQRDLKPFAKYLATDPHLAVRNYLRDHLPPTWWAKEIGYRPGRMVVSVHLPDGWEGNPTSAMMRVCPARNDNLWRIYTEIELQPFYKKMNWPSYTCRP